MIYIGFIVLYYLDTEFRTEMPRKLLQIAGAYNYTIFVFNAVSGLFSTK